MGWDVDRTSYRVKTSGQVVGRRGMENERLRATMTARGMTAQSLAAVVDVDPKTVERWVNTGRVPYVQSAVKVAEALEEDAMFLWPTLRRGRSAKAMPPEVVAVYPSRAQVSPAMWSAFFDSAVENIDILVYAAVFLHESVVGFNELLTGRARSGCHVRIAVGARDSPNVAARGREERFGHGIESRCELALMHYRPLVDVANIEVRTHGTTLYNSIFRADGELMVNTHVWGVNAFGAPVWHLRDNGTGPMATTYRRSFDAVWEQAVAIA